MALKDLLTRKVQVLRHRTETSTAVLKSNNPRNILKRGYSITYDQNNTIINNSTTLTADSKIKTTFYKGQVISKIEKVIE